MKTTDRASDRVTSSQPPRNRWFRVRPSLAWTLGLMVAAWLALFAYQAARDSFLRQQLAELAQWASLNGSALLNALAVLSVIAALAETIRSSRRLTKVRRTLIRSMKVTQRLVLGSRAA
jgi:hypothetical protein